MSVSLRADNGGATGALQLNGSDKLVLNADGTISGTVNPATGLRSMALATMQKFADEFGALQQNTGWQKLPSGLIIQWGFSTPAGAGVIAAVTLPVAYPNAHLVAMGSSSNNVGYAGATKINTSQIGVFGSQATNNVFWMSIGF
jgi:hypothetical protein